MQAKNENKNEKRIRRNKYILISWKSNKMKMKIEYQSNYEFVMKAWDLQYEDDSYIRERVHHHDSLTNLPYSIILYNSNWKL